ncbi:MAG TPA: transporter [Pelagibacterium sp.]|uniref:AEC family transporter n=1 Tax=uncultured Pelagibacterium sp. TaxID=1159875 RepID=UPI000EC581E5|nr:transporter [Pelagibacterium sp.]|tara:strand:+ start:2517 stop:3452 length:936 start_codon:yes stop_codon:yes gene_type:complete
MLALIFSALLPIALIITLGHLLRRFGFLGEGFWPQAERLAYFVLLPLLFAHGLYRADLSDAPIELIAAGLVGPAVLGTLVLLAANRLTRFDGPILTSVVQGGIRFNNYVGVTAAVGLLGVSGAALAAVANAILVPTVNIVCSLVFARYGSRQPSAVSVIKSIALNPLILGCVAGIVLRLTGIVLPAGIEGFMQAMGQAALPIGLLCVGAALNWEALGRGIRPALVATAARFLLIPAMTVAICLAVGLTGPAALVVLLIQCLPTASSAYVMARQLGGDAPLMAGIIAFQTVLGVLTVPITLVFLAPLIGAGL